MALSSGADRERRPAGRGPTQRAWWAALVAAAVVVVLVVWVLPSLLTRRPDVRGAERHKAMSDVRTSLMAMLGALGAAGGLAYTAKTFRLSQIAHLTGRFQDASKQMGEEHPAVRLGGIQAMAQLADEWTEQRQRCVDVLCAYVRASAEQEGTGRGPDRDARRRAVELIAERLRANGATSWIGCDFDFTGAVLDVGNFGGASFARGRFCFDGARFLDRVRFDGAAFVGATVSFAGSWFEGGCEVSFDGAEFRRGAVGFEQANFAGGEVRFRAARFDAGCKVTFAEARLGKGGTVSFEGARLAGEGISFADARFVTAKDGGGDVSFATAEFGGRVSFQGATFARDVRFDGARLAGAELSFRHATFVTDKLVFREARCAGATFSVEGAESQAGCISLEGAHGVPEVVGGRLGPPLFCHD